METESGEREKERYETIKRLPFTEASLKVVGIGEG